MGMRTVGIACLLVLMLVLMSVQSSVNQRHETDRKLYYRTWMEVFVNKIGLLRDVPNAFRTQCMKCICQVEGCQSQIGKCRMDVGSLSCGPYQIKKPYWIDCGRPGQSWQSCTKQMACSETCVRAYMTRYGKYCTRGREPTCKDYSLIHNGGPRGCRTTSLGYWYKVKKCCDSHGGC